MKTNYTSRLLHDTRWFAGPLIRRTYLGAVALAVSSSGGSIAKLPDHHFLRMKRQELCQDQVIADAALE